MSWRTNRKTRKPYKTVAGRSISDLEKHPEYSETVAVGLVSDVGDEYEFSDRDSDVQAFIYDFNISPDEDFGAVFVKKSALSAGDVGPDDIYFITGTVPELHKNIYQITRRP